MDHEKLPYNETFYYFCFLALNPKNEKKFEVVFLEQAIYFLESLDQKTRNKILYNLDKAKVPKAEIEKAKQLRREYFDQ